MRNNQRKQPNAYKHGVFTRPVILPGEDAEEFDALYSELIEEWTPNGATEEDGVLSLAKAIWRKRRVQNFIEIQPFKNSRDPSHASYDVQRGLINFAMFLLAEPDVAFKEYAGRCLRPDMVELLKRKVPRSNFNSTQEWAEALIKEIKLMLPSEADPSFHSLAELGSICLATATYTHELFDQELKLDERLDITIDRAFKRLIQIKAMKQMLGQTGAERGEDRVRKNRREEGC